MAEIEDELRTLLRDVPLGVSEGFRNDVDRRARRMLRGRRLRIGTCLVAVTAVVGLVIAAIATTSDPDGTVRTVDSTTTTVTSQTVGRWRAIAESPLRPRSRHVMVWTGDEVLVVGGSPDAACLGGQGLNDCFVPDSTATGVREGAAYNPRTDTWRRIADAPIPLGVLSLAAWVGDVALFTSGFGIGLVAYDPAADEWTRRAQPPAEVGFGQSASSVDGKWIVVPTDDLADQPDLAYDPAADRWSELPDDPLGPSTNRTVVWTGSTLALLAHPPGATPQNPEPTRVATYDPRTTTWTRLPDSPITALRGWYDAGPASIATLGDEQQVDGTYAAFPRSGVIELASGASSPVPTVTVPTEDGASRDLPVGTRLPSGQGGPSWYLLSNMNRRERIAGWLYSPDSRTLRRLPSPLGPPITDEAPGPASVDVEVWTGTDLVRWGGLTPESDEQTATVTGPTGAAYRPPPP